LPSTSTPNIEFSQKEHNTFRKINPTKKKGGKEKEVKNNTLLSSIFSNIKYKTNKQNKLG